MGLLDRGLDRGLRALVGVARRLDRPLPRALVHAWAMRRPLGEIGIELTSYCNLQCGMCSVWEGRRHGVSLERVKTLLVEARALGAHRFVPWGAEQLMRKDLLDVLEHAHALGFSTEVVTNETLLTEAHIERLARLTSVGFNVSIDGPREVHDALRGAGVYDKAVAAARAMRLAGIKVGLSAVVMRPTLPTLGALVDLAVELGIDHVSYQPFQIEIASNVKDLSQFAFGAEDRAALVAALDKVLVHAAGRGVRVWTRDLFPLIPGYLLDGERPIPPGGCEIPSRTLLVDRDGEVWPCFFMRERSIGNVGRGRLADLWHNEAQRALNRQALAEQCPGCLAACSDVTGMTVTRRR